MLSFTLAGLSKTIGLPQLKLAWTIVGGPPAARDAALRGLELIADTFLSVGTPVHGGRRLLTAGAIRAAIQARIRHNLAQARAPRRDIRRATCCPPRVDGRRCSVCRRRAAKRRSCSIC